MNAAEIAELEHRVQREADALAREFSGVFSPETVNRYVVESLESFRNRPRLIEFVPIFVHRYARERLRATALAEGRIERLVPEILFVCVHNAGRSQMAAAFAMSLGGDRVGVVSAGSEPADGLNPAVVEAMLEVGIDLSEAFPKLLSDEVVQAADAVITMGCGDSCPIYPGKVYQDWEVDDPSGQPLPVVRTIRDHVRERVVALLESLGVAESGG
jgi:protein-tyrosine-phosphatase